MFFSAWSRRQKWGAALGAAALVVAIVVAVVLAVELTKKSSSSSLSGAIATDAAPCQDIGLQLMKAGGNAVDVAVGVLFCEGVASAQSMGLGGGFLMTIYDRKNKTGYVLNAREKAPLAANETMFGTNETLQLRSSLGMAVPGDLAGYWAAHQKFGTLPWADLIEPTIKLCEEGVVITNYVANIISNHSARILASPTLRPILINPETGELKTAGDNITRPKLAKTLRVIATEGKDALYNGSLTTEFLKDLANFGSIITAEDLLEYDARWESPAHATLPGDLQVLGPLPPGSSALVAFFLQVTADYVTAPLNASQYHRMVEACKFMYAERTKLGDLAFVPSALTVCEEQLTNQTYADEIRSKILQNTTSRDPAYYGLNETAVDANGTAHIAIITTDYAVSVTSTINTEYGSMMVSNSTGIIMNNEMGDFNLPNVSSYGYYVSSSSNYIKPGKRPQSSMSPSIFLDSDGDVVLVLGASGGEYITSAVSQIALRHLYLGENLTEAIADKRIHHQLLPMLLYLESGFSEELAEELKAYGHNESTMSTTSSAAMGIVVNGDVYTPSADQRREGKTAVL